MLPPAISRHYPDLLGVRTGLPDPVLSPQAAALQVQSAYASPPQPHPEHNRSSGTPRLAGLRTTLTGRPSVRPRARSPPTLHNHSPPPLTCLPFTLHQDPT